MTKKPVTREAAVVKGAKAGIRDIGAETYVRVYPPTGVVGPLTVTIEGEPGISFRTGEVRSIPKGTWLFLSRVAGREVSAEADCRQFRPAASPHQVWLHASATASLLGLRRPERTDSLVAKTGERRAQTVVYVHGIGNKPLASVLKCQWDTALFRGPMGDRTRMAYWVDRDRYPRELDATCGSPDRTATEDDEAVTTVALALAGVRAEAAGGEPERVALQREVVALSGTDEHRQEVLSAIAKHAVEAASRTPDSDPRPVMGRAAARVLPFNPDTRRILARLLTRVFLRDVNDFLFEPAKRLTMVNALRDRLRGGGAPFVVIAHSQGSMVAYEALRGLAREECEVMLFVTIGTPLGLEEVKDHFRAAGPLRTPPCVGKWINVADRLDVVALDGKLAGEYLPNDDDVAVQDRSGWWQNEDSPRDPHSGTGYLYNADVQDAVREAVGNAFSQFVAGSVVSRDVAADAEDAGPHAVQDVLIQLTDAESTGAPQPLDAVAERLEEALREITAERPKEAPSFEEPDRLRRFVQVKLTRSEIDELRTRSAHLGVKQVWANAHKHALIHRSAAIVQAPTANIGYAATGRGVAWAVLDTGIDSRHPHFVAHRNVRAQWDCLKSGPPREIEEGQADPNGHGTHVAGIIAGRMDKVSLRGDPTTFSGIAPETKLYGFRVLDARGAGSDASIIKALDKVAEINERASALVIHGVNLSLGASFDPRIYGCGHTPLCQELRRLWRQGVLVVLAAGNEGYVEIGTTGGTVGTNMDLSIGDPANLEEAIAVGSVHKQNPHTYGISYFSSRGPTADGRRKPDLVAPGEKILSALADPERGADTAEGLYVEMSGTSMAAPHVSGVLAAFLSARSEFVGEPDRTKRILLGACTDLGRDPNMQGAGLVNLVKMLVGT